MPHGHFGALGPGFVSVSHVFASSSMKRSIHLFTLSCQPIRPVV